MSMSTTTEHDLPPVSSGAPTWPAPTPSAGGGAAPLPPPPPAMHPPTPPPGPASRSGGLRSAIVAAVVAALVSAGIAVPVARSTAPTDSPEVATTVGGAPAGTESAPAGAPASASIAEVAGVVSPSVAFVQVAGPTGRGSGSAVIVDADGLLLTNAHVVDGAQRIEVVLPDGSRFPAELVGSDPASDVAVLRIDATGLPALGIDTDVEVGETVIAIGSPFGLEGSVTSGIVSGVDRTLNGGPGRAALTGMIQTDAAINPGNSGGALVDARGRLIGINTAIFSASGTSSGVGFAIPAATAMAIADQLIASGRVTYAQLGISGGDVTPAVATAYGLAVDQGALVVEVLPGSAGEAAGLAEGDVIVAFDGEPITSMARLTASVRARQPGDTVDLTVVRDGRTMEVSATLGSAA